MTDTPMLQRLDIPLTCRECGGSFTARRIDAGYCSRECYDNANKDKIRARKARAAARLREERRAQEGPRERALPVQPTCPPGCQCGRHQHVLTTRHQKTCAECGTGFVSKRSDTEFCSTRCYKAQYHRLNKEKIQEAKKAYAESHQMEMFEYRQRYQAENGERIAVGKRARYAEERSDPEKRLAKQQAQREYYLKNADKIRAEARERHRRKRETDPMYGRGAAHGGALAAIFEALWEAQDGRCYLCEDPLDRERDRGIHLDHDHSCCGRDRTCEKCRRGLACKECNLVVGWARDDAARLRRIADNLEVAMAGVRARMEAVA